jgi:hypothetical protein
MRWVVEPSSSTYVCGAQPVKPVQCKLTLPPASIWEKMKYLPWSKRSVRKQMLSQMWLIGHRLDAALISEWVQEGNVSTRLLNTRGLLVSIVLGMFGDPLNKVNL